MPVFKSYPKEKHEIRQMITHRQHYLNIVGALSCLATFQLVYTYSWFIYGSEVFSNVRSDLISIVENVHVIIQFAVVFLLFMVSYAENSVSIVTLALIELIYSFVKMGELIYFYRPLGHDFCSNPNFFQCFSKYEQYSFIYDATMCFSSGLSCTMALSAFYFHTQLVWIKVDKNSATKTNIQKMLNNLKKEDFGLSTSVHSSKPNSKKLVEFARKGDKFEASVSDRKTTCAVVSDSADLVTVTNESQIQGGTMKSINKMPFTFRRVLKKINPMKN